jgi:hypothetical protein
MIDGVSNEKPNFQRFFDKISKDNTQFVPPKSIADQFVPPFNKLGFESKNSLQSNNETRSSWQRTGHKRSMSSNYSCHENLHAPIIGHFRNKLWLLNIVT